MSPLNEVKVSFVLTDLPFDPDSVTTLLGIAPTHMQRVGDVVGPHSNYRRTQNTWKLRSRLPLTAPVEDQIADLLILLESVAPYVRDLCTRYTGFVAFPVDAYESSFGIYLDAATLTRITALNAGIDLDLYVRETNEE